MTDPNPGAIWYGLGVLLVIGAILDALVRDKPGKWGNGAVSGDDTAKIVAGGKPKATARDGLKLGLLGIIAFVLFVVVTQ
jgi:hypothetical protein